MVSDDAARLVKEIFARRGDDYHRRCNRQQHSITRVMIIIILDTVVIIFMWGRRSPIKGI